MPPSLFTLRQTPQPHPTEFLKAFPGSWIQFYDDTPAKDPAKALGIRGFDPVVARRKQLERCSVCFSLQGFGAARTAQHVTAYRTFGIDVDLASGTDRSKVGFSEIDRRKEAYLAFVLHPFPLKPHWLIETRHGFHILFRISPQRTPDAIAAADALNRRLVRVLHGDPNAAMLTQVLRVPGTLQFKDPRAPFVCRLLIDKGNSLPPYDLFGVRNIIEAWESFQGPAPNLPPPPIRPVRVEERFPESWNILGGVPEGQRNAAAARVVGAIIGRLPEHFWTIAGFGGLKEWNARNPLPLPERELQTVFTSIVRREQYKRKRYIEAAQSDCTGHESHPASDASPLKQ